MNRLYENRERVTLMLQGEDGSPWTLTLSAGCERFIGRYSRVAQFTPYRTVLLHYS